MEKIFERVKKIILNPKDALSEVKTEEMVIVDFMKEYVAIVVAVPALARLIGLIGKGNLFQILVFCALFYVVGLIMVFVAGKIIEALAPTFSAIKDDLNAFKLAAYSYTPFFVAGVAFINPSLGFLSILGALYGIYILYLGIPILMEASQEKTVAYTAVAIIINAIVYVVLAILAVSVAGVGFLISI